MAFKIQLYNYQMVTSKAMAFFPIALSGGGAGVSSGRAFAKSPGSLG